MNTLTRLMAGVALLSIAAGAPPQEGTQTKLFVEKFTGTDAEAARELFINRLAATQKFLFVSAEGQAELMVGGSLVPGGAGYLLRLNARGSDGKPRSVAPVSAATLDEAAEGAAQNVAALHKRSGYVIKRDGDRVVIARGSEEGISAGQRYVTSDSGEVFEIQKVAAHTAEGRVVGRGEALMTVERPIAELGTVDIVFVIDITASMQPEIDAVRDNCLNFARALEERGIDAKLGLVTFRTEVVDTHPPATPGEFRTWVAPLQAAFGGDEVPFAGLEAALQLPVRPGAKRVVVLVTDEAAYDAALDAGGYPRGLMTHYPPACTTAHRVRPEKVFSTGIGERVFKGLRSTGTTVFTVTLDDDEGIYRGLAAETGGTFHDLKARPDLAFVLGTVGKKIEGMFTEL
jgi:hypothetical protein